VIRSALTSRIARCGLIAVLPIALLALTACGSSKKATKVSVTLTTAGKSTKVTAPKSVKGGLVEVTVHNKTKLPGDAQFVRLTGNHTAQEALKVVGGNSPKIPEWINGGGGPYNAKPGGTSTVTVNLPAGKYIVVNDEATQNGPGGGPPGYASLTVTSGDNGDLPSSTADITAKTVSKDKYAFDISGLKAGDNAVKFTNDSKGELHHVQAFPVNDGASLDQIKKVFASSGPPKGKPPVDFEGNVGTTVLNGKTDEVTHLNLKKGKYVFLCFLTDHDGGKPHFLKGLAKIEDIK
jgi:hypothetical protein